MIASKGRRSHGQSERKKYRQDHTEAKLNIVYRVSLQVLAKITKIKLGNHQPGSKPEVDYKYG